MPKPAAGVHNPQESHRAVRVGTVSSLVAADDGLQGRFLTSRNRVAASYKSHKQRLLMVVMIMQPNESEARSLQGSSLTICTIQ